MTIIRETQPTVTPVESTPFKAEGPQPLLREIPQGEPYPVEALGPLREAVEAVQGMALAPVAIPAGSALAMASLAVQGFADVETLGGKRPVSLFLLTVAKSGERKSSCDRPLMSALQNFEADQAQAYKKAHKKWVDEQELYDLTRKKLMNTTAGGNGTKATEAQADLKAMGDPPEGPILPDRTASEPTLEGLFRAFQQGSPSLGLFSDEAGQFIGGHAMSQDNRMKTLGGINSLWDGSEIKRTRAGDGVYTLRGRRLALHLMMQPVVAGDFLSDPLAGGLGFLPRCLICEPPSTIGTRFSGGQRADDGGALWRFSSRLKTILNQDMPVEKYSKQILNPRTLPLSDKAKKLLVHFSDQIEGAQAPGGDFEGVSGFASKVAEQAARIAGTLALWADLGAPEVTHEMMADAITLAQYYLDEAKRLSEAAEISVDTAQAEMLRLWLLNNWPAIAANIERDAGTITPRDVVQHGPGSLRVTKTAKKHLQTLEAHDCVAKLPDGAEVDGKPRKLAYRIVSE